jgi:prephenate dehydratase
VTIVGEHDYRVRVHLIAREARLEDVEAVLSHPSRSPSAPLPARALPGSNCAASSSTAAAVRMVSESARPGRRSAPAPRRALRLRAAARGRRGRGDNVTRFVWIAPAGPSPAGRSWKTSLVFSELGEDHPGALVEALAVFSSRGINLTRIESRPMRQGLGRYMFFCDLQGRLSDTVVSEAIGELHQKAGTVRVLGTYPVASA